MEDFWSSRLPLALAAKEKSCEIHVAAPGASNDQRLKIYGFHGHELPSSRKGFSSLAGIKNILAIRKLIDKIQPHIVHTITLKYSFLTGLAAHNDVNRKYIFTIAGLGYLFSSQLRSARIMRVALTPFIKKALRHPTAQVTFQNSDDKDILIRGGYVRPKSCFLIPGSGVDLEKFSPRPAPDIIEPPLVVMPTRLVRSKGISTFITMAKILKKRQISANFQIAGGITDHNPLALTKEDMERLLEGSPVQWLGKVSDMPSLYEKATLIVYPSWYREGIPRVLLEAAAMGKAIVTTDHPGCRDAVAHNENGLLVPIRNPDAVADAVESLLKDTERRKKMEENSRSRAEKLFDVKLIAEQTIKVYGF